MLTSSCCLINYSLLHLWKSIIYFDEDITLIRRIPDMQNIICLVEFLNQRDKIVFGMKFVGVRTRQYIYAKRVSRQGGFDASLYIRVKVSDTYPNSQEWQNVTNAEIRRISVHDFIGLHDERIEPNPKISRGIRRAIDRAIAQDEKSI